MSPLHREHLREIEEALKKPPNLSVVVMPDFFIDRIVSLNLSAEEFLAKIADKIARKGGSIDGVSQAIFRGGNAVNTASALAKLGAKVTPIVCTDKLGIKLIRHFLRGLSISLSHVKVKPEASLTTALEFQANYGKANIMLRSLGSLESFSPEDLNESDWRAIAEADYVYISNWAGMRMYGTELIEAVFRYVKSHGRGRTYLDTADPTPNMEKAPELIKRVMQTGLVDILSLNENEATFYASQLNEVSNCCGILNQEELALKCSKLLSKHMPSRVDLHTTSFSATIQSGDVKAMVSTFPVKALRVTGAGDAWNAGNILGYAYGLSDAARLILANAVAAYYISSPSGNHPTRIETLKFLDGFKHPYQNK
ncbi:MAG: carbohydrate kinase family protein [Candidatus Bathyarchaeia archaeon]